MGTHYIRHRCGHEQKHILSVSEERNGKVEWLESVVCPACYRAQKQAEREAKKAEMHEAAAGLPALEGTPKQISYAEDIRAALAKAWRELKKEVGVEPPAEIVKYIDLNNTSAKFFIERWRQALDSGFNLEKELVENGPESSFDWILEK